VVRDHLLERRDKLTDLDLMVMEPALPIARAVADQLGWAFYPLDELRDVARLVFTANAAAPLVCDIARVRGGSPEGDLLMRDFTINAMAFAIEQTGEATLLDPSGGQADLQRRLVRRVSAASLADDPVRLLRAIRFVVQLGFTLDEATRLQIKQICSTVTLASAERIRDELWKMLASDLPAQALQGLQDVGLLAHVLPEVAQMTDVAQSYPHFEDVYRHTLRVMQNAAQLRNWILGQPLSGAESAGLQVEQPGALGDQHPAMAQWAEALAPYLIPLRRHMREPLAGGRNRAEWLVWHAMLHDIGKPVARTEEPQPNRTIRYRFFEHERYSAEMVEERLTALRFSKPEVSLARRVAQHHMRPHLLSSGFPGQSLSRRAKYRFLRDTFPGQLNSAVNSADPAVSDGIDVLCLAIADYQATHRHAIDAETTYLKHAKEILAYAFESDGFSQVRQQTLVDGRMLMATLDLPPGRRIGELLAQIQEAQAAGEVDSAEAALTLAATWLNDSTTATV
ncbi:MAG: HD domain-containing protein, partial [Caldilineaceae bacterium]|nr:HD domain-containing protein [Caldilineaceae bacterium]